MKVIILAGGFGTRISEESNLKPKPMIEIGGMPILWHIMKLYSYYGFNDFVICAGYKQYMIKEYFANYYLHHSDITFNFVDNTRFIHSSTTEPWVVTIVDTGLNTMTGGRIRRVKNFIGHEQFLLTYGDGVSDVNIKELIKRHNECSATVTMTGVSVGQKFGVLDMNKDGRINSFREKNDNDGAIINGGFMVCEPEVFDYISDDSTVFENEPLAKLSSEGKLNAYLHRGFWHCMDTKRDHEQLEAMWASNNAPWKVWKD